MVYIYDVDCPFLGQPIFFESRCSMSVEINVTGEVVTAYLKGEIDHHTAREMREAIDSAI